MVKEVEGTFKVDGLELYTKSWLPDTDPIAKLIIVHGFSDHINRYCDPAIWLAERGFAVHGFDQRGWGRSVARASDRGRTGVTSQVIGEVAAFIRSHIDPASTIPVFVLGHSMGGNIVLTLCCDAAYDDDILRHVRGWVLEAPFIDFPDGERPSVFKVWAGRLAAKVLPHQHLKHVIPPEALTRDPAMVKEFAADELCHDTGTLEGLAASLDRSLDLTSGKAVVRPGVRSLWLGHGTADLGTSYTASKAWFDKQETIGDKTFKTYEGWYHVLHSEPEKEEFFVDVRDWLVARCGAGAAERSEAVWAREEDRPVEVVESGEAKKVLAEEEREEVEAAKGNGAGNSESKL